MNCSLSINIIGFNFRFLNISTLCEMKEYFYITEAFAETACIRLKRNSSSSYINI